MNVRQKNEVLEGLENIQLDFMQMKTFARNPIIFKSGKGIYLRDINGVEYVDGISGIFVANIGYGNKRVKAAMKKAIDELEFWPVLHGTTTYALKMAKRLSELLPKPLSVSKFASGGSEATECAVKWSRQYHIQTGNPLKFKVVSRHWSYHGATKGSLSASGVRDKVKFEPLSTGYCHVLPPYSYRCPFGCDGDCNLLCADAIEWEIRMQGRETVSAVIVDPVMAAAGVLVPVKEYYKRLREICNKYEVLLIFDEIVTGFGRLGTMFASNYYGSVPDIVCLGKGMASGYAPLSATVVTDRIADAFKGEEREDTEFLHGTTYGGHPLACAAGLAVTDEIIKQRLPENSRSMGDYLMKSLTGLMEKHTTIGDIRGLGLLVGVEFVRDRKTKKMFDKDKLVAPLIRKLAFQRGLIIRGSAHVLTLAPSLIVKRSELDRIVGILDQCISKAEKVLA